MFGRKCRERENVFDNNITNKMKIYDIKCRGMAEKKIFHKLKFNDSVSFMFHSLSNLVPKLKEFIYNANKSLK